MYGNQVKWGQDLFITYGGMGDGGGVALFSAIPEPSSFMFLGLVAIVVIGFHQTAYRILLLQQF